jgi:tRNA threonylcarbamoyladenosine biosynthesis protein TsaE
MTVAMRWQCDDEAATAQCARRLARCLQPGDVVALIGPLGSGKTRFVAAACGELGVRGRVRSPSYTLLNVYRGRMPVYHFDLYRWEAAGRDAELAEWEEYAAGEGVSFIEWAERLGPALAPEALIVRLAYAGETGRAIELEAPPGRAAALRAALAEEVE